MTRVRLFTRVDDLVWEYSRTVVIDQFTLLGDLAKECGAQDGDLLQAHSWVLEFSARTGGYMAIPSWKVDRDLLEEQVAKAEGARYVTKLVVTADA